MQSDIIELKKACLISGLIITIIAFLVVSLFQFVSKDMFFIGTILTGLTLVIASFTKLGE